MNLYHGSAAPAEVGDPGVQRGREILRALVRIRCLPCAGRILASGAGERRPLSVGKTILATGEVGRGIRAGTTWPRVALVVGVADRETVRRHWFAAAVGGVPE